MDPRDVLALLAADDRLRAVAALVLGASSVADVAAAAGLDARAAAKAISRLEEGGLVEQAGSGWRFRADVLAAVTRATAPEAGGDAGDDPARAKVLRAFLRDGRLTTIPASRGKRLVVLDVLAQRFEPGARYPERDVNDILRGYHDDVAALRRYLVDEGFLTREKGEYWRSGGTYEVG